MPDWQSAEHHSYYVDGDVVFWRFVETMQEPHIEHLLTLVDEALTRFAQALLIVDCRTAKHLSPEARRRYAEWLRHRPHPHRAAIFFGVNEEMQAFLELARRGGELLSGQRSAIELVAHEEEAWQRAADLRAAWQTRSSVADEAY